ncbi:MAG: protein-disulfide reductase DsbD [Sulfurifustis sp.]
MKMQFAWILVVLVGTATAAPGARFDDKLETAPLSSNLPRNSSASSPIQTAGGLKSLAQLFDADKGDSEVVDPEKAFRVEAAALDGSSIAVRFLIDGCCYLYREKMRFSLSSADGKPLPENVRVGAYTLPPGDVINDEFFGRMQIYRQDVGARLPIENAAAAPARLLLNVTYQGCSEKGVKICYPPATRAIPIQLGSGAAASTSAPSSNSPLWAILAAFAGGLLLTFTPCVLPMIPILSGVIVGAEGTHLTKFRGGMLSYTYVLGTAFTYAIAGAIAGATGEQLQAYFQNPWAIGLFSVVLVLLALSMFGLYELQMPAAIQSLLHHHSSRLHHKSKTWVAGEYAGVFLLGAASALIVGACVAPVLAFSLASAIATRDAWLGAGIMFALAHGQGAILIAIGVSEGFLLPRAGPWMHTVKHIFGVLLLAVAIYLLGALPQVPVLFLWAALLIVCAIYLGATQSLPKDASGWRYLQKGIGTLALIWGVAALLGGFAGNRDVLRPIVLGQTTVDEARNAGEPTEPVFKTVRTLQELETQLVQAHDTGKPVILDYYATWCTDCVRMERSTFRDPRVRATMLRFVALQADVTAADDPEVKSIKRRFSVYGPPAMLFFASDGAERRSLRSYGYQTADELLAALAQL